MKCFTAASRAPPALGSLPPQEQPDLLGIKGDNHPMEETATAQAQPLPGLSYPCKAGCRGWREQVQVYLWRKSPHVVAEDGAVHQSVRRSTHQSPLNACGWQVSRVNPPIRCKAPSFLLTGCLRRLHTPRSPCPASSISPHFQFPSTESTMRVFNPSLQTRTRARLSAAGTEERVRAGLSLFTPFRGQGGGRGHSSPRSGSQAGAISGSYKALAQSDPVDAAG